LDQINSTMPKKINPKTDHHFHHILSTYNETLYAPEDVNELAVMVGGVDDLEEFHERLERAADIYRIHKNNSDEAPTDPQVRAALNNLNNHAKGLLKGLETLDYRSWVRMLAHDEQAGIHVMSKDQVYSLAGKPMIKEVLPDGSKVVESLGPDDFVEMARLIHLYVEYGHQNLPTKGKSGRRKLFALSQWLPNIKRQWEERSGKRFTVDEHNGTGITDAFHFCKRAMINIDPKVTDSNLITAMKSYIKNH